MPTLTNVDDDDEEEDNEENDSDDEADNMPALTSVNDDDDDVEVICKAETEDRAFVTTTFKGHTPAMTLTFMDSGTSDYFFKNCEDFTDYTPVMFCTGSSAIEGKGTFEILEKGTVSKTFCLDGRDVKLTFKNALHSPSLTANLMSVSSLDRAGLSIIFSKGCAAVHDQSGKEIFAGYGSDGM
ncbi:hypothetical protein F5146DRAFT_1142957 [Armillaria mellea]|nr:hypothetical protein F5146DRAFT_1142957 [Armillaria mellea]